MFRLYDRLMATAGSRGAGATGCPSPAKELWTVAMRFGSSPGGMVLWATKPRTIWATSNGLVVFASRATCWPVRRSTCARVGLQRVTVIGISGTGAGADHELAAGGAGVGHREAYLDAELPARPGLGRISIATISASIPSHQPVCGRSRAAFGKAPTVASSTIVLDFAARPRTLLVSKRYHQIQMMRPRQPRTYREVTTR